LRSPNRLQLLIPGLLSLALVACSNDKGKDDNKAQPSTPDEAISKLSDYHKTSFETWKSKVAKSCDASTAFGISDTASSDIGVDGKALLNKNAGSLVFVKDGGFTVLTGMSGFSGVLRTESESTSDVNGQVTTVSAKTERLGSNCVVYLFGQKVYETTLAANFVVGAEARLNRQTNPMNTRAVINSVGSIGSAEVTGVGVAETLMEALKPSIEVRDALGQSLGMTAQEAQRLLQLSPYPQVQVALRLANEISSVWNLGDSRSIVASRSVLVNLFTGQARAVKVDVRLAIPQMKFVDQENSADKATLDLSAAMMQERGANGATIRLEQMRLNSRKAFDVQESNQCLSDRVGRLVVSAQSRQEVSPAAAVAFAPCRVLNPDIEKTAQASGFLKTLMPLVFGGLQPSPNVRYNGWDAILSRLIVQTLDDGKDLRAELDPQGVAKIMSLMAQHLSVVRGELPRMKNGPALKEAIDTMALQWGFQGQSVGLSRIGNIIYSVDIAADPFTASSRRLLLDLGREPNSRDGELSFASTMDAGYKAEALKTLALAKELEERRFEADVFNQVLQLRTSVQELQAWSQTLTVVKNELTRYPNLAPQKSMLSSLAVKWMKSGEVSGTELPNYYQAISNVIDVYPASTDELLKALERSVADGREGLFYARTVTPEMKNQSLQIVAASKAAGYEAMGRDFIQTFLQRRPNAQQVRDAASLWSSISGFTQRELARIGGESAVGAEWRRKALIEKAIQENWTAMEFQGLESIAVVALSKSSCERHKDVASLADCAGALLFSKTQRMFFDPSFQNRYTGLAADLSGALARMTDFNWVSLRGELVREFFGSWEPLWSRCDQSNFSQKAAELKMTLRQILGEPDSFKRFEKERRIGELVRNCN
jgi:hypothetical protein